MTLAWHLTIAYVVGSAIYEIGGSVALIIAIGALLLNSFLVHRHSFIRYRPR